MSVEVHPTNPIARTHSAEKQHYGKMANITKNDIIEEKNILYYEKALLKKISSVIKWHYEIKDHSEHSALRNKLLCKRII